MTVPNNDFTTIYRDAVSTFAARGVAILAVAIRRSSSIDPDSQRALEAALADLEKAAAWGARAGQTEHAEAIRDIYKGKK